MFGQIALAASLIVGPAVVEPVWEWGNSSEPDTVEVYETVIGPAIVPVDPTLEVAENGQLPTDYLIHCGNVVFQITSVAPEFQEQTLKGPGCWIEMIN